MECFGLLMRSARSSKRRVDPLAFTLHPLHVIVSIAGADTGFCNTLILEECPVVKSGYT